jgi:MFS family permease
MSVDATASNVMVGIGETYLPAFVLALTGSQLACGLTPTVPLLLGAVIQLITPFAMQRLRSYRRWVVVCAIIQAASFIPLVIASLVGAIPVSAAFLVISIYWATGQAGGTAWNAWAENLVPERVRARYFAHRTRFIQFGLLGGFVVGGIALQVGHSHGFELAPFALLFLLAAIGRIFSANYLKSQSDCSPVVKRQTSRPWKDFFELTTKGGNSRVILFVLAAQLGCQISGPYFTPYMLKHLELSYLGYVTLICIAYLGKIAIAPTWGRVVEKIGVNRAIWLSGLLIVPQPMLWNISDSFYYLSFLQFFAGAAWGAYEISNMLLIIESIPAAKKINVLTVYNFANALAIVGGSFIGGFVLTALGGGRHAYAMLFIFSSVVRVLALTLLVKVPLRLPVFGRAKKATPRCPVLIAPDSPSHCRLKSASSSARMHAPHPAVPKPVFLRVSPTENGAKESQGNSEPAISRGKRI